MAAADDFLVIEPADLREIAAFGKHELRNAAEFGRPYRCPPVEDYLAQQFGRSPAMLVQQTFATLDQRHDAGSDHCLEQFLLAGEIQVEGPLAHTGARGNLVESG